MNTGPWFLGLDDLSFFLQESLPAQLHFPRWNGFFRHFHEQLIMAVLGRYQASKKSGQFPVRFGLGQPLKTLARTGLNEGGYQKPVRQTLVFTAPADQFSQVRG